ncbi:uncharacterized protein RAG0_10568 [Rhynchosporium agropyri]|uniref:Dynactin arp1 p25 subunit n=1 Tax=Rhynchosporium agropyri TaxID=914238 RepID=A0A1E1L0C0_9HELO|nr:uncharacterized protein RAG0_10568 [Rhynchosporium agropyri]
MIGMRSFAALVAVLRVVYGSGLPAPEDDWHLTLLKRQAPGTPQYACHFACGTAITLSRGASPCTNDAFLTDYADCLACAGPADMNIWKYYGGTLTTVGTTCGLSTTPGAGPPKVSDSSSTIAPSPTNSTSSEIPSLTAYPTASLPGPSRNTTIATTHTPSSPAKTTTSPGSPTTTSAPVTGGAKSANGHVAGALAIGAGIVFAIVL